MSEKFDNSNDYETVVSRKQLVKKNKKFERNIKYQKILNLKLLILKI